MNNPKMTISQFRDLTLEKAVEMLSIEPTDKTYVYLNEKMRLDAIEIQRAGDVPEDEFLALGFVRAYRGTQNR